MRYLVAKAVVAQRTALNQTISIHILGVAEPNNYEKDASGF
jgi:hypothetical protein